MPLINHAGGGGGTPQLCAQVENFAASPENLGAALSWTAPTVDEDSSFVGVRIVRKAGSTPAGINDGTVVYEGTALTYTDTGLTAGTTYYYRAFAYNAKKKYQTAQCTVSLTAIEMSYASDLPVGALIAFPVNGVSTNYIVVHQGKPNSTDYDDTADGTWIMSEKTFYAIANHTSGFQWNTLAFSAVIYGTSLLCAELDGKTSADGGVTVSTTDMLKTYYPKDVLSRIKTVNVPFRTSNSNYDNKLQKVSAQLFAPSLAELGISDSLTSGAKLDYFLDGTGSAEARLKRIRTRLGTTVETSTYWTRDPYSSAAYASQVSSGYPYNASVKSYTDIIVFSVLNSDTHLSATPNAAGAYTFI